MKIHWIIKRALIKKWPKLNFLWLYFDFHSTSIDFKNRPHLDPLLSERVKVVSFSHSRLLRDLSNKLSWPFHKIKNWFSNRRHGLIKPLELNEMGSVTFQNKHKKLKKGTPNSSKSKLSYSILKSARKRLAARAPAVSTKVKIKWNKY